MIAIGSSRMMKKRGGPASGKEAGLFYYPLRMEEQDKSLGGWISPRAFSH
jgi:hypothetical protein